jgi:gamma-glutamylcyclotransferase (GGCT)/AIG2-like uncharacterized protein YtfP
LHLFAYGTLMCPEIMARVTGAVLPEALPARLDDFRRGPLAGAEYPAIFPCRGGSVEGLLYLDLPDRTWPRLDDFEGRIYSRERVEVTLADSSRLGSETYVLRPEYLDRLLETEWSYALFLASGLSRFMSNYENFPATPQK